MFGLRAWIGRHVEAGTLLIVLAAVAGLWGFLALAGAVGEGGTQRFDTAVLLALRNPADLSDPIGPGWVEEFGRDMTALGGVGVLTIITLAVAALFWLQDNRRSTILLLVSIGGGRLLGALLKFEFGRPRPDLVPHGSIVYFTSFPSGHSMMAAIVYLTLAILVARVEPRRSVKIFVVSLAAFLTLAVGVSRVYLGVHWPTDVIAGWTVGTLWALMTLLAAQWLENRGAVEPAQDAGART